MVTVLCWHSPSRHHPNGPTTYDISTMMVLDSTKSTHTHTLHRSKFRRTHAHARLYIHHIYPCRRTARDLKVSSHAHAYIYIIYKRVDASHVTSKFRRTHTLIYIHNTHTCRRIRIRTTRLDYRNTRVHHGETLNATSV